MQYDIRDFRSLSKIDGDDGSGRFRNGQHQYWHQFEFVMQVVSTNYALLTSDQNLYVALLSLMIRNIRIDETPPHPGTVLDASPNMPDMDFMQVTSHKAFDVQFSARRKSARLLEWFCGP